MATAAVMALMLRPARPGPAPEQVARTVHAVPDLIAGRDLSTLHPAWIGLGRVTPPAEPLLLAPELASVLASRRVPVREGNVVFYMLDPREQPAPGTPR